MASKTFKWLLSCEGISQKNTKTIVVTCTGILSHMSLAGFRRILGFAKEGTGLRPSHWPYDAYSKQSYLEIHFGSK